MVSILNNITKHLKKEDNIMRPPLKELRNKLIREARYMGSFSEPTGKEAMTDFMKAWYIYETAKEVIDYDLCAEVKGFLDNENRRQIYTRIQFKPLTK